MIGKGGDRMRGETQRKDRIVRGRWGRGRLGPVIAGGQEGRKGGEKASGTGEQTGAE